MTLSKFKYGAIALVAAGVLGGIMMTLPTPAQAQVRDFSFGYSDGRSGFSIQAGDRYRYDRPRHYRGQRWHRHYRPYYRGYYSYYRDPWYRPYHYHPRPWYPPYVYYYPY